MKRRLFLLMLVPAACAAPQPSSSPPATSGFDEPEEIFAPGPIPWDCLTDEQQRRARQIMIRAGGDAADEEALIAQWDAMSPAQQRFALRRPSPPPPPTRPAAPPAPRRATPAPSRPATR